MALTGIASQKTPSVPVEIITEPETGLPSANQSVLIYGRAASTTAASSINSVYIVANSGDPVGVLAELNPIYGAGSELVKAVVAAINANADVGNSNFPQLKVIALPYNQSDWGVSQISLSAANNVQADFITSPFDGSNVTLNGQLESHVALVSGATRTENNQFGSFGVVVNQSVTNPNSLPLIDDKSLIGIWFRDTGAGAMASTYSLAEHAAAAAALMASNAYPFNGLDNAVIGGELAPAQQSDWISVGAALESEAALNQGWTPIRVLANGDVAFVRTVTARITNGAGSNVTAYYDVQDWQVLYFWRKTVFTRSKQSDFQNVKASAEKATALKGELIRLAKQFEVDGAFQQVDNLAPQFVVQRNASDRNRFDVLTPVNVVPNLHVIAVRVAAGTQFDAFTV